MLLRTIGINHLLLKWNWAFIDDSVRLLVWHRSSVHKKKLEGCNWFLVWCIWSFPIERRSIIYHITGMKNDIRQKAFRPILSVCWIITIQSNPPPPHCCDLPLHSSGVCAHGCEMFVGSWLLQLTHAPLICVYFHFRACFQSQTNFV